MRTLFTADLIHADEAMLMRLVEEIKTENPDVLIIAGNTGTPLEKFKANLALFNDLECAKALVTGNVDLWNQKGDHPSQQIWEESLPLILHPSGFTWLEQENLIIERVGICGTMGWYDYSGRDTKLGYTVEQYQELKGLVNQDAQCIDWPWEDRDFASYLQDKFTVRLESLERDRGVDHILVVTHFPVLKESVIHIEDDIQWRFSAAYTYNLTLGRVIAPKTKVRHVVSAHLQPSGHWEITFGNNAFHAHVIGRKGNEPQYVVIDI